MTLKEELEEIRRKSLETIPARVMSIIGMQIGDLIDSDIPQLAPQVGERIPDFSLPDTEGMPVSMKTLRDRGTVIVSFYRGGW